MASLRELAISIGWRINDAALRRADQLTDRYRDNVQGAERGIENLGEAVSELGGDFRRSGLQAERSLDGIGNAAEDVKNAIRGIPDPEISGERAEQEIVQIEVAAEDLAQAIRSIPDPEIDGSQAKKELESAKQEASQLQEILGAITGGAAGAVIGSDITTFAQMPREFQAQLGVAEDVAKELAIMTEQLWTDIPGITQEGAYEAIAMANQFFDAVWGEAYDLGKELVLLHQQTGMEMAQLARAANLMESRFADIESPQEALNTLAAASQRLPRDVFEELIDQTEEYGGNIAAVGLTANDFFSAMIQGGERGRYVMDRLGDSIANELIPKIRNAEDDAIDALTSLAGFSMGLSNVTMDSIEEFEKLNEEVAKLKEDGKAIPRELTARINELSKSILPATKQAQEWQQAIVQGGEEGREAILEIAKTLGTMRDEQQQSVLGGILFGEMFKEQEDELLPILENLGKGFDDLGGNIEDLAVRGEGPLNDLRRLLRNIRVELDEMTGGAFGEFAELVGAALPGALAIAGANWVTKLFKRDGEGGGGKGGGSLGRITGSIGRIAGGIGKFAGRAVWPLGLGLGAFHIARAAPEERGGAIGSVAGGLGGTAAGAAIGSMIAPGIGTLIGGAAGGLLGSFGGGAIGNWIQGLNFSAIGEKVKSAGAEIKGFFSDTISSVSQWSSDLWSNMTSGVRRAIDATVDWFIGLPEDIAFGLGYAYESVVQFASSLPARIGEGITNARNWVTITLPAMWNDFTTWLGGLPGAVGNWFMGAYTAANQWLSNLWSSAVTWAQNTYNDVTSWFGSIVSSIVGFFSELPGKLYNIASRIPGAIMDGFNWAVGKLGDFGRWVIEQVSGGIEAAKDIGRRLGRAFEAGREAAREKVPGHAMGGIFSRPHYALFAEDGPEAVVPLSRKYRDRALNLWMETGRILGVRPYAEGGFTTSTSVASRVMAPTSFSPTIQINVYGGSREQATSIKRELERYFPQLMEDYFEMLAIKMG